MFVVVSGGQHSGAGAELPYVHRGHAGPRHHLLRPGQAAQGEDEDVDRADGGSLQLRLPRRRHAPGHGQGDVRQVRRGGQEGDAGDAAVLGGGRVAGVLHGDRLRCRAQVQVTQVSGNAGEIRCFESLPLLSQYPIIPILYTFLDSNENSC